MLPRPMAVLFRALPAFLATCLLGSLPLRGQDETKLPIIDQAERQVLKVQVGRLLEAMDHLGVPLSARRKADLAQAFRDPDPKGSVRKIQAILDPLCLVGVVIDPGPDVKVIPGPAGRNLVERGWRQTLAKVYNRAGVRARLAALVNAGSGGEDGKVEEPGVFAHVFDGRPLEERLSSAAVEYRILQLYSHRAGKEPVDLNFEVESSSKAIGLPKGLALTFTTVAVAPLTFKVLDENGNPSIAALEIRDAAGDVYPSQASRTPPDFTFHPQVYRENGGTVDLPPGDYTIGCSRGPEYLPQSKALTMGAGPQTVTFNLQRWIDPSLSGWWSGDHHIHAAGCKHFTTPTQGVLPKDMAWHIRGEDLKIGGALTWGPGFDYQKQFFTGAPDPSSQYPYLIRYDIEVSGFGSAKSGHLCLLRLQEGNYPGGTSNTHWPTLGLTTLKWAQAQGAVCGPAHSGWGLSVGSALPSYVIPSYNGIGAHEYIVDVTHTVPGPTGAPVPAVDFMSTVDTPYPWELTMWYHTLNCGYRTRISGETDFPCIYGERVGIGRAYVKVGGPLTYDTWCDGIEKGRAYVSDGRSHFLDFTVGGVSLAGPSAQLDVPSPGSLAVTAQVAAFLPVTPNTAIQTMPYNQQPYWHLERARIGTSRDVKVELVVNGYPVASQAVTADGTARSVNFNVDIFRSSWVTLRILAASHTNPIFVVVGGKPVRASLRSARWCRAGVDQCWSQKQGFIAAAEVNDAIFAYDFARGAYDQIISESQTTANGNGATFHQDPGSQGIVSIEAETPTVNAPQGSHSWVQIAEAEAAGGAALQALPNNATEIMANYSALSPRLDLEVQFAKTGTHYVWIRGRADSAADDTAHAGLDGSEVATGQGITGAGTGMTWMNTTVSAARATLDIASTGKRTVNVWMAKDGFVFDKLVLTTDPAFVPSGAGPALSLSTIVPPNPDPDPDPGPTGGGSEGKSGGCGCGLTGMEIVLVIALLHRVCNRGKRSSSK